MKCFCHKRRLAALLTVLILLFSSTALAARYSTLKYGDQGEDVLKLQKAMQFLGYDPAGTDGKFGRGTENAVKRYQTANRLEADGKAGHQTLYKLYEGESIAANGKKVSGQAVLAGIGAAAPGTGGGSSAGSSDPLAGLIQNAATSTNPSTIKYGDSGYRVTELQTLLKKLGYAIGTIDGKFGTGTLQALVQFQKDNNLEPDGMAGTQTLLLLSQKLAEEQSKPPTGNALNELIQNAASSTNPDTIKYGDKGSRVTELQTLLNKLGYSVGTIDGHFGTGTLRALVQFQKDNNLVADGMAGTQTMNLIRQKAAALGGSSGSTGSGGTASDTATGATGIPSVLTRTLYPGYTGQDVLTVQKRLKELGYYTGLLDGVYGTGTGNAVRSFQARNGLTADGIAGARTFKAMYIGTPVPAAGAAGTGSTGSGSGASGSGSTGSSSGSTGSSSGSTGTSTGYATLQYGSRGEAVRQLQTALKKLNYNVSADGEYGALTQMAVKAFQQCNKLTATGIADPTTQALLYSGKGKPYDASIAGGDNDLPAGAGQATGPSTASVKLLHWFNDIKPTVRAGQTVKVFDPATNLQWTLKFYSLGRHADSEPLTELDTKIMFKAFGNKNTWTPKPVYVQLPSGVWTLATMHNVPHLSGSIQNNGFDGHLCVHFLRDMDECSKNDPNYGVQNQKAIRKKWQEMTGQVVE